VDGRRGPQDFEKAGELLDRAGTIDPVAELLEGTAP